MIEQRLTQSALDGTVVARAGEYQSVGINSPNECERVKPAQSAWVFATPAPWVGPMVTRGGRSPDLPSSLAFNGLLTRRCPGHPINSGGLPRSFERTETAHEREQYLLPITDRSTG